MLNLRPKDPFNIHLCTRHAINPQVLAKAQLALGVSDEAIVHFTTVIDLGTKDGRDSGLCNGHQRSAGANLVHSAQQGCQQARIYDKTVRKAFWNLCQTRDVFYMPIVGSWRSWRKNNGKNDALLDLPTSVDDADTYRRMRLQGVMLMQSSVVALPVVPIHYLPTPTHTHTCNYWFIHSSAMHAIHVYIQ